MTKSDKVNRKLKIGILKNKINVSERSQGIN